MKLSNPIWLKYGIMGGTVLFLGLTVFSLSIYEDSGPFFAIAFAMFFLYLTYRGAVLCRYLNTEVEVEGSNVRLIKGDGTEEFPLSSVRFKFEDWIQIVSVYNLSEGLIFAIDYVGQDIEHLKRIIQGVVLARTSQVKSSNQEYTMEADKGMFAKIWGKVWVDDPDAQVTFSDAGMGKKIAAIFVTFVLPVVILAPFVVAAIFLWRWVFSG